MESQQTKPQRAERVRDMWEHLRDNERNRTPRKSPFFKYPDRLRERQSQKLVPLFAEKGSERRTNLHRLIRTYDIV